jgi:hypothetical protein
MSWLNARKRGKKIISYEYRWKERGVTKSRSTGTADRSIALKIQKKWDAIATLQGPEVLTNEHKLIDLTIAGQVEQFLKEKRIELKPGTMKRYEYHARFLQEFFKKKHIKFFDQLNAALMREYKTERLGGNLRVVGTTEGAKFKILWYDPENEVCLSMKKTLNQVSLNSLFTIEVFIQLKVKKGKQLIAHKLSFRAGSSLRRIANNYEKNGT